MSDYVTLVEGLVKAASPCFSDADRDMVDNEMAAGEHYYAIDDALRAVVREDFALPPNVIADVKAWLDEYDAPADLRRLVGQVKTSTAA